MPSGKSNPLFVSERSRSDPNINGGEEVDLEDVDIGAAMAEKFFSGPTVGGIAGFGGPSPAGTTPGDRWAASRTFRTVIFTWRSGVSSRWVG
jgi:hypothetical protein